MLHGKTRFSNKSSVLRWEIGFALLLKILLLTALWMLIFRWQDRPASKPDIAARFALTAEPSSPALSSQLVEESRHDR